MSLVRKCLGFCLLSELEDRRSSLKSHIGEYCACRLTLQTCFSCIWYLWQVQARRFRSCLPSLSLSYFMESHPCIAMASEPIDFHSVEVIHTKLSGRQTQHYKMLQKKSAANFYISPWVFLPTCTYVSLSLYYTIDFIMHYPLFTALLALNAGSALALNSSNILRCGNGDLPTEMLRVSKSMARETTTAADRSIKVDVYFHVVSRESNQFVTDQMLTDQVRQKIQLGFIRGLPD